MMKLLHSRSSLGESNEETTASTREAIGLSALPICIAARNEDQSYQCKSSRDRDNRGYAVVS